MPLVPPALNTGGSLPDLTNLHFPSPLPTPLDPDEAAYPSLSGGNSTSNLANTMTHLGISGNMGLGTGYELPGEGPVLLLGTGGSRDRGRRSLPEDDLPCGYAGQAGPYRVLPGPQGNPPRPRGLARAWSCSGA